MAELESCANLVNTSAFCARSRGCSLEFSVPSAPLRCEELGIKPEDASVADILAELQRERQKNAELMERISLLEAQIQEKNKASLLTDGQDGCHGAAERSFKKLRRQLIEHDKVEDAEIAGSPLTAQIKHDVPCRAIEDKNEQEHLVNWMSMDETQFLNTEKYKDVDYAADHEDTDDSDDEDDECYDEDDIDIDDKNMHNDGNSLATGILKRHLHESTDGEKQISCSGRTPCVQSQPTDPNSSQEINGDQNKGCLLTDTEIINNKKENRRHYRKENKKIGGYKTSSEIHSSGHETGQKGFGSSPLHKKPPKVAFCPKEVKRIIESDVLLLKNAQSHTIRKIVVFASLGIRHGCEDMYELDFNHFSILRKGEPYVSPKNPGEHVLYEHRGVQRKVFYPNRHNPTLCPVKILEEEKAMRPSDPSCPSCLFLCIKYGGRTRNLPQNEYVRQRMGRNKLKSFGPLMCQMAMLVNIRNGSFFFKALGITLLFMAGFPDDLVQRETKYRNLDLLQKYYRTDEDAEGEVLFHPYPVLYDTAGLNPQRLPGKAISNKSSGKKQTVFTSKPPNLTRSSILPSVPSSPVPPTQFGLMGYTSIHGQAMAAFQSLPSHTLTETPPISNSATAASNINMPYPTGQTPTTYPMFAPHPGNTFVPIAYWPHTNAFPSCPYPASYGCRSFAPSTNYISLHPHPYYGHPSCGPLVPKVVEGTGKKDAALEEADSDSDSSSVGTEPKRDLANCK
ncbi:PREDICTED: uncharacterized protein LOC104612806 isoform X2 [Nelumbo nucifera]|uniref:Uncharacterized protein LOC104612806 isoform X2 n=2 Tax=Nelumbo nucifera TaxID=4432 RepID=A0A1U8BF91_NELNU|nr:PREDICTED: uncharacterized protein LOC104612806 isoform X2 [Nelumbo nucifera]DAD23361.1 TPA_asm: hypothetical protein HUJ06_024824 [Nelumbo nucifera]